MSPERFEHLLSLVAPHIGRLGCRSRNPISESERLMITLRYLATGESQQSLAFSFRLGRSTVCNIVRETCQSIWMVLATEYLKYPSTTEEWLSISSEFEREWNFPHCWCFPNFLLLIDGRYVYLTIQWKRILFMWEWRLFPSQMKYFSLFQIPAICCSYVLELLFRLWWGHIELLSDFVPNIKFLILVFVIT